MLLLARLCVPPSAAQKATPKSAKPKALQNVTVAPDLDGRLSHYKSIEMPFNKAGLSAREIKLAYKLAEAGQYLDDIYWRQSDPEALALYKSLAGGSDEQSKKVRHFLKINASRFDLIDENKPFIGSEPMPPGRGFYPKGLTKSEIESYLQKHPEKRAEIYSPTTVVERRGEELVGVPYHVAYKPFLQKAAKALHEAADLTPDKNFAAFLKLRADALLSDDYLPSDLGVVEPEGTEVRHHLRAIRNLHRRTARRERFLWCSGHDPQRSGEPGSLPSSRNMSLISKRHCRSIKKICRRSMGSRPRWK